MPSKIFFYIPNLIGYSRILFAVISFYYIYTDFIKFYIFYSLSAVLDIADGYAARSFNQCTKFGAVLDMITDRASTSCLIIVLAQFYPKYSWWFLYLVAIDIMSHFARIYGSLVTGHLSHKEADMKQGWLLNIYYTNRLVLGFLCFGNEGFFIMLHMMHFWLGPMVPVGAFFAELLGGSNGQLELVKAAVFLFFFPIMAVKQFINVVQLQQACLDIVDLDEKEAAKSTKKS